MKKLVIFTLAMVLALSGSAFALLNDNAVAVDDSQAASDTGTNVAVDASKAAVAAFGAQSATSGGENEFTDVDVTKTDVEVKDVLNNLRYNSDNNDNRVDNRNNYNNDNSINVVDNAILANVNVKDDSFFGAQTGRITFIKSQHAEINGSFGDAAGVSNVNSAAGNMNKQNASTTISIGSIGSSGGRH